MERDVKQLKNDVEILKKNSIGVSMSNNSDVNVLRAVERVLEGYINFYVGRSNATARIHIGAGTTNKYTAPLKFTNGELTTVAEEGAFEFASNILYFTPLLTRYKVALVTTGSSTISSGTYTPALVNVTNVTVSTPRLSTYVQVGDTVTVSGQFDIDPTVPGATELSISLPIPSVFTTAYQAGGTASSMTIANESAGIEANVATGTVYVRYVAVDTTNHTMSYQFTYQIL